MVVAEVLTGIALVKQATDFIKSNIDTVNDIGDIAKSIDDLIKGEQQAQKDRFKKGGGFSNFDTESVAQEVIDAKLAQERLKEISVLIDLRFGHGTWASILAERKKRIDQAKKEETQRKLEASRKQEEIFDLIKMAGIISFVVGVGIIFLIVMIKFFMKEKTPQPFQLSSNSICDLQYQKIYQDKIGCVYMNNYANLEIEYYKFDGLDIRLGCPKDYECKDNPNKKGLFY